MTAEADNYFCLGAKRLLCLTEINALCATKPDLSHIYGDAYSGHIFGGRFAVELEQIINLLVDIIYNKKSLNFGELRPLKKPHHMPTLDFYPSHVPTVNTLYMHNI